MGHGHTHEISAAGRNKKPLMIVFCLTFFYLLVEVIGGFWTGSLALLADASAVGLADLATRSPFVFGLLRYAGVAYLLWLAWKAWTGEDELSPDIANQNAFGAWFRHGLLLNLLNPKAAVFFVTVLPAYIAADAPVAPQTALLSASYVVIATAIHLIIVAFAGHAHNWISVGKRSHIIRRVFAGFLATIAIWFLISTA